MAVHIMALRMLDATGAQKTGLDNLPSLCLDDSHVSIDVDGGGAKAVALPFAGEAA